LLDKFEEGLVVDVLQLGEIHEEGTLSAAGRSGNKECNGSGMDAFSPIKFLMIPG
jgi:hypothetical protein